MQTDKDRQMLQINLKWDDMIKPFQHAVRKKKNMPILTKFSKFSPVSQTLGMGMRKQRV